jgi:uncharacterized coiled-coil protein SlyX
MTKVNKRHEPTQTQIRAIAHSQQRGEETLRERAETIGELKDKIIELEGKLAEQKHVIGKKDLVITKLEGQLEQTTTDLLKQIDAAMD